jgi:hypothetical protein
VKKLVVRLPEPVPSLRLAVLLAPMTQIVPATPAKAGSSGAGVRTLPKLVPLEQWASAAPLR